MCRGVHRDDGERGIPAAGVTRAGSCRLLADGAQRQDCLRLLNRAADGSKATEILHRLQEGALLRTDDPAVRLDLQSNELSNPLAEQLRGDLQRAQADQITAALANPEAHEAPLLVDQSAGVVAPEPYRSAAADQADALLDLVFAGRGGHASCCRAASGARMYWQFRQYEGSIG